MTPNNKLEKYIRDQIIWAFGLNVLAELKERGFDRMPEADADGNEVRYPGADGRARDGFRAVRQLAFSAGLLDETRTAPVDATPSDTPGDYYRRKDERADAARKLLEDQSLPYHTQMVLQKILAKNREVGD
jgi:hypothetical protein